MKKSSQSGRKSNKNKKIQEDDSSQKKITSFFKKQDDSAKNSAGTSSSSAPLKPSKTSSENASSSFSKPKASNGNKRIPLKRSNEDIPVIDLSDDDESDYFKKSKFAKRSSNKISISSTNHITAIPQTEDIEDEADSCTQPLPNQSTSTMQITADDNSMEKEKSLSGETLPEEIGEADYNPTLKMIGISNPRKREFSNSMNDSTSDISELRTPPSTPKKLNSTPPKSPKARINKFSPIRHLAQVRQSRSRSQSQSPSRSPKKFVTPTKSPLPSQESNGNKIASPGVVRKLDFSHSPSNPPYYLKNFQKVIDAVIQDSHIEYLMTEDDRKIVQDFNDLSFDAQRLFVRLFTRKWRWKQASTIESKDISVPVQPLLEELHKTGFLMEIRDQIPDLSCLLDLLTAEQMSTLSKQMRVPKSKDAKKTKDSSKSALMNIAKNQHTLSGSSHDIIVKCALKLLDKAYQIDESCKTIFSRIFILHSPPMYFEDEQNQASNQLLNILLTEMGKMNYPTYSIKKCLKIYKDRNELIRFHESWMMHCDITAYLEDKNWTEAIAIGKESVTRLSAILENEEIISHDQNLPSFLKVYTAGSVLTRTAWLSVEAYQKLKEYKEANSVIELLLGQKIYLSSYRGRWHERLIINLKHLQSSDAKMKDFIESSLRDNISDGCKLTLTERLEKLVSDMQKKQTKKKVVKKPPRKKSKKVRVIEDSDSEASVVEEKEDLAIQINVDLFHLQQETPSRKIQGEKILNPNSGKSIFIGKQDSAGSNQASSVELFAIEFYKTLGYHNGLHAEGAVITSIYGLLFWDEIYNDEIPDAFHTPYQSFPLDMHFEDFYERRKDLFANKLDFLRNSFLMDDALNLIERNWNLHCDKLSIVGWTVFPNLDKLKGLVKAMGLPIVASICERMCSNYRYYRSGFPDLVVWNENDFMFIEVKGPGDTLSPKQKLWIDFLLSIHAKTEVCHVEAVSNKRIIM